MGKLLVLLTAGAAAALLLWVVVTWQPPTDDPARIYYESERYTLLLEQERESAAQWASFTGWFVPMAGVVLLLTLAGAAAVGLYCLWPRRRPLVYLDALQLPIDRRA